MALTLLVFSFCFFIKVVHTGECTFCTGLSIGIIFTLCLIASCVLLCCFILGPEGILSKKYDYYLEDNSKIYAYKLKVLHRKKRFTSFPSPAGMSLTKLPLGRNNSVMTSLFPPNESLVVTSRLGTGNSRTFF
jgi:hypothetical protein